MATVHVTAPTLDNPLTAYVHRVVSRDAADIDETLAHLPNDAAVTEAAGVVGVLLTTYDTGPPRHVWAEGLTQAMLDVALRGAATVGGRGRTVSVTTMLDDYAVTVAASMARRAADVLAGAYHALRSETDATVGALRSRLAAGALDPDRLGRRAELASTNVFHTAFHAGAFDAVQRSGQFQSKTWNHDGDPVTPRDWHEEMDGETVAVDEPFSNGLMFPHDPDGDPEETYNCTCSVTYST